VPANADIPAAREITSSEAEQIEDDNPVSRRDMGDDILPKVRRGGKPMEKENGIPVAARSSGVIVEPRAREIEKFSPHEGTSIDILTFQP
jgi:hypothetical protein